MVNTYIRFLAFVKKNETTIIKLFIEVFVLPTIVETIDCHIFNRVIEFIISIILL